MIRVERAHLQVSALSHPGMSGKINEDRFAVSAFQANAADPIPVLFAVLADGIGGHRAGEIAAELAVNLITHRVAESDGAHPTQVMAAAIRDASQQIHEQAQSSQDMHGMGATCACAWVIDRRLYTATVGDSRIYLLRGAGIQQISIDHTWIQEALERGTITLDQVRGHPNAHVIRRYLGSSTPPRTDLRLHLHKGENEEQALANQGLELRPDDVVLLCSDGLTDLVGDREIHAALFPPSSERKQAGDEPLPLEVGVKSLVDLACLRGGNDNITIICLRVPPQPAIQPQARRPLPQAWRRAVTMGAIGLVSLLLLAAAVWAGLNWVNSHPGAFAATPSPALLTSTSAAETRTPLVQVTATATLTATARSLIPLATAGPTLTPWPTHTLAPRPLPSATLTGQ